MDASSGDSSSPRSRQQLQGPRPPRLAVSKESHKVRKPPIAPQRHQQQQPAAHQHQQYQHQQVRQPVIIYDASPKVIHTKPGDFMALVQRLTGPGSTAQAQFDATAAAAGPSAAASSSQSQPAATTMEFEPREFLLSPTAALSPAARLAAIERSVRPLPPHHHAPAHVPPYYYDDDFFLPLPASGSGSADVDNLAAAVLGPPAGAGCPGILSPAALPPAASTGLFSPTPFDPSCLSWLSELSPFLPSAGTRAAAAGLLDQAPFAPSPRSSSLLLSTPTLPSPATVSVLEFFSSTNFNFPDL
ncbi:unnamed protein product [Miscanthus lutarioriparius]|uniref:VQ domain-containing protein n=1 Tax=Miscanthus lutarioriparius TaxID=422564 RepID=A0A811PK20_9POAL|nr:unnamed protein product [Miscanthus lutarioriparius]